MPTWLPVVAVGAIAFGLAWWTGERWQERVLQRILRRSRGRAWRAALSSVTYHVGALLLLGLGAGMATSVDDVYGERWLGAAVMSLATIGYLQLIWFGVPSKVSAYAALRDDLRELGATPGEQRAVAWVGGPLTVVGLACAIALLFEVFS